MENTQKPKIVIVGGGVGGVRTALELSKYGVDAEIILIDNKFHFEYHAALYRVVTGGSVMEVCIPYEDVFKDTNVRVVEDTIDNIVSEEKHIWGTSGSKYHYDSLVLALGSESNYFGIEGLEKYAFEFKTTNDALRLRNHLEEVFKDLADGDASQEEKAKATNIVIVGAGATGVEIAGQMVEYCRGLAKKYNVDPSYVSIQLIEAKDRVLPLLSENISRFAEKRLRKLGVNIFLNRIVQKEELEIIHLKTMEIETKTVIWTAGVKANHLYRKIDGAECNGRGCVKVSEDFEMTGVPDVYVVGDGAEAVYGGMAQTADEQGAYMAKVLAEKILAGGTKELPLYKPKKPVYVVPIGKNWAVAQWGKVEILGYFGWFLRRAADLRYFSSILPPDKAIEAFKQGKIPCRQFEQDPTPEEKSETEEETKETAV